MCTCNDYTGCDNCGDCCGESSASVVSAELREVRAAYVSDAEWVSRCLAAEAQVEALTEALQRIVAPPMGRLGGQAFKLQGIAREALSRVPTEKSRAWKEFIENPQRHETTESEWENDGGSV